ncbi:Nucleotide-diphospho-sugar transferase [Rhypophila sp. PSN 637]
MRSRLIATLILSALSVALLFVLGSRLIRFSHIFRAHAGPALTQEQVELAYNSSTGERKEAIPRIIHQIFHNFKDPSDNTIPEDWEVQRQTCIKHNPDFEYKLWTPQTSLEFLEKNYAWFVDTYNGYKFPVQRIDALRYFLMRHFGGIYIDLDNGCMRDLKPLLHYPAWVTDGGQGTLSNNLLGARPGHPFWDLMTDSLIPWGYHYPLPYLAVSYASGQWYETALWEDYHNMLEASGSPEEDRIYRIMMDMREGADRWVFFTMGRGGSWDQWDNHLFGWTGNVLFPWLMRNFIWIALGLGAVVLTHIYLRRRKARKALRYKKLDTEEREESHELH